MQQRSRPVCFAGVLSADTIARTRGARLMIARELFVRAGPSLGMCVGLGLFRAAYEVAGTSPDPLISRLWTYATTSFVILAIHVRRARPAERSGFRSGNIPVLHVPARTALVSLPDARAVGIQPVRLRSPAVRPDDAGRGAGRPAAAASLIIDLL